MKFVITPSGTLTLQTLTSFWNAPFKSGRFRKQIEEATRYAQRLMTSQIDNLNTQANGDAADSQGGDDWDIDSDVEFWELGNKAGRPGRTKQGHDAKMCAEDSDSLSDNLCSDQPTRLKPNFFFSAKNRFWEFSYV